MRRTPEIAGLGALRPLFGQWPPFHDAEILRILLDRKGPTISLELLVPDKREGNNAHYDVHIVFQDIDALHLEDFNHQNVVFSLTVEAVTEEPPASGKVEERIKVGIHSVFGADFGFTCSGGKIVRVKETDAKTGTL